MTALAIVTTIAGVIVATDGGAYAPDGTLLSIGGKVIMLPEASTVITNRGSLNVHLVLQHDFCLSHDGRLSLDSILARMPENVARINAFTEKSDPASSGPYTIYVVGWSESRQSFEAWAIGSEDDETASAGTLYRLPECFISPEVHPEVAANLNFELPSSGNAPWRVSPMDYAVRAVCCCRFCEIENRRGGEGASPFIGVGAFVQATFVQRHSITSSIIHEWPDEIGKPIDPTAGSPCPGMAFKNRLSPT